MIATFAPAAAPRRPPAPHHLQPYSRLQRCRTATREAVAAACPRPRRQQRCRTRRQRASCCNRLVCAAPLSMPGRPGGRSAIISPPRPPQGPSSAAPHRASLTVVTSCALCMDNDCLVSASAARRCSTTMRLLLLLPPVVWLPVSVLA
jgi:hypothetical protein